MDESYNNKSKTKGEYIRKMKLEYTINWNLVFSATTAIVAIIGIFITIMQQKASNKQHLFDHRLENYLIVKSCIDLFRDERNSKNNWVDEEIISTDIYVSDFTNNSYLESICECYFHPLEGSYQKSLHIKLSEIENLSVKTRFLFKNEEGKILSLFMKQYKEFLFAMYQYSILHKNVNTYMLEHNTTRKTAFDSMKEVHAKVKEKFLKTFSSLDETYKTIEEKNIIIKAEKQIVLY